jgi:hypothetical protein
MRDPSGGLPAYIAGAAGSCLIGSDPEIIAATDIGRPPYRGMTWRSIYICGDYHGL